MFLTVEEIERLTGYKHKSKQCEYLRANYIPFRPNAMGEPIVCASHIQGTATEKETQVWHPRLSKAA
jgi:hypothetical protein